MGRVENLAVSAVLLAVLYLSAFVLPLHSQPSWALALSAFALLVAFSVWALIDCLRRPKDRFAMGGRYAKPLWAMAILFTAIVGALLYYFLIKRATPSI
ncbi:MAG: DUF2516 family protein [Euryarchaeota archaeon]|nr:DUF2516 family protein [Euryarchaeota archaeon]